MKYSIRSLISLLFVSLVIIGCASKPPLKETEFHLTQEVTAILPHPSDHKEIEHQQLLTTTVRGHDISFYGIITIKDQKLQLMALTPLGIRIFNTEYDGTTITTEQYIPDIPLPNMTEVIANIMLAYYSPKSWYPTIPQGWKIEDHNLERIIYDSNNKEIFKISYEKVNHEKLPIKIQNTALNYTIELNNLN